jgi:hypothetical protein
MGLTSEHASVCVSVSFDARGLPKPTQASFRRTLSGLKFQFTSLAGIIDDPARPGPFSATAPIAGCSLTISKESLAICNSLLHDGGAARPQSWPGIYLNAARGVSDRVWLASEDGVSPTDLEKLLAVTLAGCDSLLNLNSASPGRFRVILPPVRFVVRVVGLAGFGESTEREVEAACWGLPSLLVAAPVQSPEERRGGEVYGATLTLTVLFESLDGVSLSSSPINPISVAPFATQLSAPRHYDPWVEVVPRSADWLSSWFKGSGRFSDLIVALWNSARAVLSEDLGTGNAPKSERLIASLSKTAANLAERIRGRPSAAKVNLTDSPQTSVEGRVSARFSSLEQKFSRALDGAHRGNPSASAREVRLPKQSATVHRPVGLLQQSAIRMSISNWMTNVELGPFDAGSGILRKGFYHGDEASSLESDTIARLLSLFAHEAVNVYPRDLGNLPLEKGRIWRKLKDSQIHFSEMDSAAYFFPATHCRVSVGFYPEDLPDYSSSWRMAIGHLIGENLSFQMFLIDQYSRVLEAVGQDLTPSGVERSLRLGREQLLALEPVYNTATDELLYRKQIHRLQQMLGVSERHSQLKDKVAFLEGYLGTQDQRVTSRALTVLSRAIIPLTVLVAASSASIAGGVALGNVTLLVGGIVGFVIAGTVALYYFWRLR